MPGFQVSHVSDPDHRSVAGNERPTNEVLPLEEGIEDIPVATVARLEW